MTMQSVRLSALWDAVCDGDQQSYAILHYNLYRGLFCYARGIVKDERVAEDLIQDLFVKLWVKKEQIGVIVNVKAYTYQAIRSMCFNYLKKVKATQAQYHDPDEWFQLSIEDSIAESEATTLLRQRVEKALSELPPRQREIVYLRFFEMLEYDRIVEITGVKYQSVINHIYRAIQLMRCKFSIQKEEPVVVGV